MARFQFYVFLKDLETEGNVGVQVTTQGVVETSNGISIGGQSTTDHRWLFVKGIIDTNRYVMTTHEPENSVQIKIVLALGNVLLGNLIY